MLPLTRRRLCSALLAASTAWVARRAIAQGSTRTQLVLLGTQGGPNYNLARGETSCLLIVDSTPYLVDCGYGTLRAVMASGASYRDVGTVFLTHLHDDHTADLPALLGHQWTQGRVAPTTVYGPHGTDALVAAAVGYNKASADIRLIDEARTLDPATVFSGVAVPALADAVTAFDDGRLRASAVENSHYPEESKAQMPHRALSWRFDCPDRSIVISGDTAYSGNLVRLARGADVLVCEAIEVDVFRRSFERMVANGNYADNPEGVWNHIVGTHTTTEEAGRMAQEAGVGTLVLNHLIPGALADIDDETYINKARAHFSGEIVVGRDQLVL